MKKPLFLSVLISLFMAAGLFAESPLELRGSDLRLVPDYQGSEIKGYHLYVRKTPKVESVMLTESAKDPNGVKDSYALRAFEYNSINGDEIRYLNGKKLDSVHAKYSLIDSTAEKHPFFKEAFHIYIPLKVKYGYPWARSGEIEIKDGVFLNIRSFGKKYGDYAAGFADYSFVLDLSEKSSKHERGYGRDFCSGRDFAAGDADETDEVSMLKKKLAEAEKARAFAEKRAEILEKERLSGKRDGYGREGYGRGEKFGGRDGYGREGRDDRDSRYYEGEKFGNGGSSYASDTSDSKEDSGYSSSSSSSSASGSESDSDSSAAGSSGSSGSSGFSSSSGSGSDDSSDSSDSKESSSVAIDYGADLKSVRSEGLGSEYYNKEAEKSYDEISDSSIRSKGPETIVSDVMSLLNDDEEDTSVLTSVSTSTGASSEHPLIVTTSDSSKSESSESSSDSSSSTSSDDSSVSVSLDTSDSKLVALNTDDKNADSEKSGSDSSSSESTSSESASSESEGDASDSVSDSSSDSSSGSDSSSSDVSSSESSSSEGSTSDSAESSSASDASSSDSSSSASDATTSSGSGEGSSEKSSGSSASASGSDSETNPQQGGTLAPLAERSIERDYNEEAGKRFLEVSQNLTYSKGPETLVEDVVKTLDEDTAGKNKLDLVFVIDATGSMKDDIEQLRQDLIGQLNGLKSKFETFRVGLVFYRDYGDDFSYYGLPVKYYDFTEDLTEFAKSLGDITITGSEGGDIPEAVYEGLYAGLALYTWNKDAHKKIILIGDAEPHPKPRMTKRYTKQLVTKLAKDKGVKIDAIITPDGRIHGEN